MNKKQLRNALTALLLMGGVSLHAQTTIDGLTYTFDDETMTATLKGFETVPDDSIINIPENVVANEKIYAVTAIGDRAFYGTLFNKTYLEKMLKVKAIVIAKTVKAIGQRAFSIPIYKGAPTERYVGNLERITFAEGSQLESIGREAFGGSAIFELDLPEGLKTIGLQAFYGSRNLKRIGLPSTLDSIANEAFCQVDSLRDLKLPEKLRVIGNKAFYQNDVTEITLPASLERIGSQAFSGVNLVRPLGVVPPAIQSNTFASGVKVDVAVDIIEAYLAADVWKDLNVTAGSFVDSQRRSFDIIGATKVRLTNFNTGYNGTINCVTIPESETVTHDGHTYQVAEYAPDAFYSSYRIDTLRVERSYTELPNWRLSVRSLYLPASVTDLTKTAFIGEMEIRLSSPQPPAITNIKYFTSLYMDESLIPAYAASKWAQVPLNPFKQDGLSFSRQFTVEKNVWVTGCYENHIMVPITLYRNGLDYNVSLAQGAFQNNYELESAEIAEGFTTLPNDIFHDSGVKSVKLSSTLTSIGQFAFAGTRKLHSIDLPERLDSIAGYAFFGSALDSIHLPGSVRVVNALALNSISLKKITLAEGNEHFCTVDDVLFSKDKKVLWAWPGGKVTKHYDIPEGTEQIISRAFSRAMLTSVSVPSSFKGIRITAPRDNTYAFDRDDSRTLTVNASSLEKTFYEAIGTLSKIYLPSSFDIYFNDENPYSEETQQELWADWNSKRQKIDELKQFYTVQTESQQNLPYQFTCNYQFKENSNWGVVNQGAVIQNVDSRRLPHHLVIPAEITIQVRDVKENLKDEWLNTEEQAYHVPVVGIADNAFAYCDSLVSVTLPAGIRYIGEAAFYGCKNLESVSGLKNMDVTVDKTQGNNYGQYPYIYNFAFAECPKLKSLDFGGLQLPNATHVVGSVSLSKIELSDSLLALKADSVRQLLVVDDGVIYQNYHAYTNLQDPETGKYISAPTTFLTYYPAGREATEFVMPDSVNEIGWLAFAYSHIEKLTWPAMSKSLYDSQRYRQYFGGAAFYGNHSLKEVVLLADSLAHIPGFSSTVSTGNGKYVAYGKPYTYNNGFIYYYNVNVSDHGYVWTEYYPSFDFDYTRENTVVYMKQSVIDKAEELEQKSNTMTAQELRNSGISVFRAYKQFFKDVLAWQNPSGIESIATDSERTATQGWYSLDGRRISKPVASGLYIHNGRKVVVK